MRRPSPPNPSPTPRISPRPPQRVSRRPWAAAASQLCPTRALPSGLPLASKFRSREGPTVPGAPSPTGFPSALAEGCIPTVFPSPSPAGFPPPLGGGCIPTVPPARSPAGFPSPSKFPSRLREGYRSRTSGCHRQFARAQLCPRSLLRRTAPALFLKRDFPRHSCRGHHTRVSAAPRVSPRAWVCEKIPYRAQRFLCGGSRTLRRPLNRDFSHGV
jgi:hypothetical protein